jgi:hypothetical protein
MIAFRALIERELDGEPRGLAVPRTINALASLAHASERRRLAGVHGPGQTIAARQATRRVDQNGFKNGFVW